jgi:hypothetical protein
VHDTLSAAIEPGRNCFSQRRNLSDMHSRNLLLLG